MAAESKNQKIFWLHVARLRSTTNAVTVHSPKKEVNALKVKNTRHVSPTKEPTNKVCTSRLFKNRKEINMKTISVKQPWAWLICAGIKPIENRTWSTKFRGRVLIHASANPAGNLPEILTFEQADFITRKVDKMPPYVKDMPFSAIIGSVEIVDCVTNHPSIWAQHTAIKDKKVADEIFKVEVPVYNWVLANPILFDKPIENVKGKLSFWEYELPEEYLQEIERKLKV